MSPKLTRSSNLRERAMGTTTLGLSSGHQMSVMEFGVWQIESPAIRGLVHSAIRAEYLDLDCAGNTMDPQLQLLAADIVRKRMALCLSYLAHVIGPESGKRHSDSATLPGPQPNYRFQEGDSW